MKPSIHVRVSPPPESFPNLWKPESSGFNLASVHGFHARPAACGPFLP